MSSPFMRLSLAALTVMVFWSLWGCKPDRAALSERKNPVVEGQGDKDELVVARIGDRNISVNEIMARLDAMPVFVRMRYRSAERRREFLESYVQYQVLALEARRAGYGADPEVVDALKSEVVARYLRENVDSKVKSSDIPEEKVLGWYESHSHLFHRPAQVALAHVMTRDGELASNVVFRARKLCGQPGADPREEFSRLVTRYSEDEATHHSGGDIGLFPRVDPDSREVPPEVAEAAGRMKELFEVSDRIQAGDGFHVLFVSAVKAPVEKTLDQARTEIVPLLMEQERLRLRKEFIDGLMKKSRVVIHEEAVRRVVESTAGKETQ
ncbi:MAG: peptidyl-prolyl cis-trans isomerase [Deltaproteobacteria bacterium]|nr:peptidyl-prolyl cis-trans isomerase [Deltaproteobacteria bacterium]